MIGAVAGNDLPFRERPITPASLSTIGTCCATGPVPAGSGDVADLEDTEQAVGHLMLGVMVRVVHAERRDPRATNSYVNVSPGLIGGWVTSGTPSIAFGTSMPWKWIAVDCGSSLSEHDADVVAGLDLDPGSRAPARCTSRPAPSFRVDLPVDDLGRERRTPWCRRAAPSAPAAAFPAPSVFAPSVSCAT